MSDADERVLGGVRVRPVAGFAGYWVGEDGRMFSQLAVRARGDTAGSGQWRQLSLGRRKRGPGYVTAHLRVAAGAYVTRYVHRLVLEAFIGPCPPGLECCHGPGGAADNRLENLRWDTRSSNAADTYMAGRCAFGVAKQSVAQVQEIRRRRRAGQKYREIAADLRIPFSRVQSAVRFWKNV